MSNIGFSWYLIGVFYFTDAGGYNIILINNVTFSNIGMESDINGNYGLFDINEGVYTVIIDESIFELKRNLILVYCHSSSECNVTIKNSIFSNNIIENECYNVKQVYNGFYLESAASATLNLINNMVIQPLFMIQHQM